MHAPVNLPFRQRDWIEWPFSGWLFLSLVGAEVHGAGVDVVEDEADVGGGDLRPHLLLPMDSTFFLLVVPVVYVESGLIETNQKTVELFLLYQILHTRQALPISKQAHKTITPTVHW